MIIYRNEDYCYGSLTLTITLWPMILFIITNLATHGLVKKHWNRHDIYALIPLIQTNKDWGFLKEIAKLTNEGKSTNAKKSEMAEFAFYQCVGESAPQFILQMSILLYENENAGILRYLTIGTSCLSLVWGLSSTYLCLPTLSEDGHKVIPFQTMKNLSVVLPSMIFVAIPKFIVMIIIFGSIRDYTFAGFVIGGLIVYCLIYFGLTLHEYCKLRKEAQ